jgi:L-threonylcarbamoyladenylate synthase
MISTSISKAITLLNQEELVAIPTETVYGLAGNIYSEKAIQSIFQMKKRPFFNPLIVHIKSIEHIDELATAIPEKARKLAETFWPGPLTLILKKKDGVPYLVTGGKDTVAIRVPNHPICLALLNQLDFPLAAPSANPFGCISPTSALHVEDYFKNDLGMVLDGGECLKGIESTIIGFDNGDPILYRLGSVSIEEIEDCIGPIQLKISDDKTPTAPGMLSKHYAPKTSTFLKPNVLDFIESNSDKKIGVLLFKDELKTELTIHQEILSSNGDIKEAAFKLYSTLHKLDKMNLDMIVAEYFPDFDLGKTINDRLNRATKK